MDCISSLPDEILYHILSLLSTKEAALTSVLAKRWRNLFAFTPNLRFEEKDFVYRISDFDIPLSFIDFLDRVLALSGNSPLKEFSLKYRQYVVLDHTKRWICNVLSRGVLDHLHIDIIGKGVTSLPLEVFTCETLVKLQLGRGVVIAMLPENASLPALKTLFLHQIRFSDRHRCAIEALLSACPVLEELVMRDLESVYWKHCTVSCPTLQRLTVNGLCLHRFGWPDFRSISLDTPSLAYLEHCSIDQLVYPIVNFDSLVEAKLNLSSWVAPSYSNPENLIKGLRNFRS